MSGIRVMEQDETGPNWDTNLSNPLRYMPVATAQTILAYFIGHYFSASKICPVREGKYVKNKFYKKVENEKCPIFAQKL